MQRPLPAEESALSIKTCHIIRAWWRTQCSPWSVLCSVALTLDVRALRLHSSIFTWHRHNTAPFTQDVFIALELHQSFQTWPFHYLGPPFPIIQCPSSWESRSLTLHPFPKTHWIFWSQNKYYFFQRGKPHTHKLYFMTVKVCFFAFLISLRQWPH